MARDPNAGLLANPALASLLQTPYACLTLCSRIGPENRGMHAAAVFFLHALSTLFLIGLAGSAVVVVITFVEDLHDFSGSDDTAPASSQPLPPVDATRHKR